MASRGRPWFGGGQGSLHDFTVWPWVCALAAEALDVGDEFHSSVEGEPIGGGRGANRAGQPAVRSDGCVQEYLHGITMRLSGRGGPRWSP
jgi:hypothetical protein